MTPVGTEVRWLGRLGGPTSAVLFLAAALLAAAVVIAVIDGFTSPLPPVRYGIFGGPQALIEAGLLAALFIGVGFWAARGLSAAALARTLLALIAAGPIGWSLAFLDPLGPGWITSPDSGARFVAVLLLEIAPLVTAVGVAAALAEGARHVLGARSAQSAGTV